MLAIDNRSPKLLAYSLSMTGAIKRHSHRVHVLSDQSSQPSSLLFKREKNTSAGEQQRPTTLLEKIQASSCMVEE
jgi:hypothetical protein